jgi:pimeloyl-ACP methyl ester carboxylesterase
VATIDSRQVQTADLNVHYLTAGEGGSGEPVVLVHGFPQTSYEWRHQLPALAAAGHPA